MAINTSNIHRYSLPIQKDFHALTWSEVDRVMDALEADNYRKPKNANGSTARYYFEAIKRKHKTERKREGLE